MQKSTRRKKQKPRATVARLFVKEKAKAARKALKAKKIEAKESRLSLPPAATDAAQTATTLEEIKQRKQRVSKLPGDSKVRTTAAQIIAMKVMGYDDAEIAAAVGLRERSLRQYMYLAAKHGWLTIADPEAQIEYNIAQKVVRNLDTLLDDASDMDRLANVTLKTAEGTIFKKIEQKGSQQGQPILAIKIEHVTEGDNSVRPDTTAGVPNFLEAETVKE